MACESKYKLVRVSVVLVVRTSLHAEPQTAAALAAMGRDLLVVAAVYAVLLFHIDQGTTFKHLAVIVTYIGYIGYTLVAIPSPSKGLSACTCV